MKRKIAIVTGGGSGLGFAIAEKFVQNGIETIIAGRNKEKLDEAAEKLGALCHAITCDLADLGSIPGFVQTVIDQYGQIDILVNNAGINMKKDFTEVTDEEFQQVITTNITAVFSMSREVVKNMLQNVPRRRKQGKKEEKKRKMERILYSHMLIPSSLINSFTT